MSAQPTVGAQLSRLRKPVAPVGRVIGVDAARCVALLGMIATHVLVERDADGVSVAHQLAGGRASALFAVLAGVSLALVSGGSTPLRGADRRAASVRIAVRALLIALVGLVLGDRALLRAIASWPSQSHRSVG